METTSSIEIERPIDVVFDYTLNNVPEWSLIVVEDEPLEHKEGEVGSTFRIVTEERGQRMEFEGLVTEHAPPYRSAIQLKGKQFDIEAWYAFEDLSGRTLVTQRSVVQGKGFVKVMFFLFGWAMKKSSCNALNSELESLKQHCEAS